MGARENDLLGQRFSLESLSMRSRNGKEEAQGTSCPFLRMPHREQGFAPLFDGMELLGADLTRARIRKALELLSANEVGLSKKSLKALEKEYRQSYGNRID